MGADFIPAQPVARLHLMMFRLTIHWIRAPTLPALKTGHDYINRMLDGTRRIIIDLIISETIHSIRSEFLCDVTHFVFPGSRLSSKSIWTWIRIS